MDKILEKIISKLDKDRFIDQIATELSGTEFNSLMLEIFRKRATVIQPAALMEAFEKNRFVQPGRNATIKSREMELEWLKHVHTQGFHALTLSPVAPIGCCAAVATVNQNKVLSSLKGTEVVADASNMLALKIAQDFKEEKNKDRIVQYATVHRHIRAQAYNNPDYAAHFSVLCMASGGFDRGGYNFEINQLNLHMATLWTLLKKALPMEEMTIKFYLKSTDEQFAALLQQEGHVWSSLKYELISDLNKPYYHTVQFKIFITVDNIEMDIADGGFVDWTQQLIPNKKHRLIISAAGLELVQILLSRKSAQ